MPMETRNARKSGGNHGIEEEEIEQISYDHSHSDEGMEPKKDNNTSPGQNASGQKDSEGRDDAVWIPSPPLTTAELEGPYYKPGLRYDRMPRVMELRLQAASGCTLYYRDTEHAGRSLVVPTAQCPVWAYWDVVSMTAVMANPPSNATRHIESHLQESVAGSTELQQQIYQCTPSDILAAAGKSANEAAYWPKIGQVLAVKEGHSPGMEAASPMRYRVIVVVTPHVPTNGGDQVIDHNDYHPDLTLTADQAKDRPDCAKTGHSRQDNSHPDTPVNNRHICNNPPDLAEPASQDASALGSVPRQNGAQRSSSWNYRGPSGRQQEWMNMWNQGRQPSPSARGTQYQQHQGANVNSWHNNNASRDTSTGRSAVPSTDYRFHGQPTVTRNPNWNNPPPIVKMDRQPSITESDRNAGDRNNNRPQKHVVINAVPRIIPAKSAPQQGSYEEMLARNSPQNRTATDRHHSPDRAGSRDQEQQVQNGWQNMFRREPTPPRETREARPPHRSSGDSSFDTSEDGRAHSDRYRRPSTSPGMSGARQQRHGHTPSPPRSRYHRDYSPYDNRDAHNNRESRPINRSPPYRRHNSPPYTSGGSRRSDSPLFGGAHHRPN